MNPLSADIVRQIVRRNDPDRYFTALFAPAARRDTLFTLYAFNHELARAREVAHEPALALIRLQWWREVVQGAARPHEVATPLHAALAAGSLHAPDLLAMIAAREIEADPEIPTLSVWRAWLLQGPGSLAVAASRLLGAPQTELDRQRALGAGYGVAGVLRSIPSLARQGRCLLPADLLGRHGLTQYDVIHAPANPALAPVRDTLAAEGRTLLGPPRRCARAWIAASLPAVLARRDLAHPGRVGAPRLIGDRVLVTLSALTAYS